MKRPSIPKRRDRRTGVSPYERRHKKEWKYSTDYQTWRSGIVKKTARPVNKA